MQIRPIIPQAASRSNSKNGKLEKAEMIFMGKMV
jgi:hypothetical protein